MDRRYILILTTIITIFVFGSAAIAALEIWLTHGLFLYPFLFASAAAAGFVFSYAIALFVTSRIIPADKNDTHPTIL